MDCEFERHNKRMSWFSIFIVLIFAGFFGWLFFCDIKDKNKSVHIEKQGIVITMDRPYKGTRYVVLDNGDKVRVEKFPSTGDIVKYTQWKSPRGQTRNVFKQIIAK